MATGPKSLWELNNPAGTPLTMVEGLEIIAELVMSNPIAQHLLIFAAVVLIVAVAVEWLVIRNRRKRDQAFFSSPLEGAKEAFPDSRPLRLCES